MRRCLGTKRHPGAQRYEDAVSLGDQIHTRPNAQHNLSAEVKAPFMIDAGYLGLFASAFLASTLVPVSSEAVLGVLAASAKFNVFVLVSVATLGNTLGAVLNWLLGRFCLRWQDRKWFPVKPAAMARATAWFQRFGIWSILLAWVPLIGDPLTFVAGVLRMNFWLFVLLVGVGKAARYVVVAAVAHGLWA